MNISHETVQSAYSYGASAGGLVAGTLADAALHAQHATIFVALLVGVCRLVYDGTRLWRYIKRKNKDEQSD